MEQELLPDEQLQEQPITELLPDNTGEIQVIRDKGGKFVKGSSGNPHGKPPGSISLTTKIKERLAMLVDINAKRQAIDMLADNMVQDALDGKNGMDKMIWAYLDGMPTQQVKHSGEIKTPIPLDEIQENNSLPENKSLEAKNPTDPGGNVGIEDSLDNPVSDSTGTER